LIQTIFFIAIIKTNNFQNRFVDTNIIDGDLTPILEHPTIRTVGFLNKRHYNFTDKDLKAELDLKSTENYKEYLNRDKYQTFKYDYE
jgi:hypothetical protein